MRAKVIDFPRRPASAEHLSAFQKRNKACQGAADLGTPMVKVELMLAILRADAQTVGVLWQALPVKYRQGASQVE